MALNGILSLGTGVGKENQIVNEASTQSVLNRKEKGKIGKSAAAPPPPLYSQNPGLTWRP